MLHSVAGSFRAIFALRFLLGEYSYLNFWDGLLTAYRDVRIVCCSDPDPDHIYVLQEKRASQANFLVLCHGKSVIHLS
jgi:hypothetical protein